MDAPGFLGLALLRLLAWCCLIGLGGLAWVALSERTAGPRARGPRIAVVVALALLAVRAGQLLTQTWSFFTPDEPVSAANLALVAGSTTWGAGWMFQAAAAVAIVGSAVATRTTRRGWYALAMALAASALFEPLTGHAVEGGWWNWRWALQAVHVGAVMVWIGGLTALTGIVLAGESTPESARRFVERFSPLAVVAGPLVVASGVATGWLSMHRVSDLWQSSWGLALILKTVAVGIVVLLGLFNWRIVRPQLASAEGDSMLRRSASAELLVALLVLAVTAALVALPLPIE